MISGGNGVMTFMLTNGRLANSEHHHLCAPLSAPPSHPSTLATFLLFTVTTQPQSNTMSAKKIDTSLPAAAAGKTVFLTGATGYIGGQVFQKLLSLSSPPSKITFLLRDEKKTSLITSLETPTSVQLAPLVGSLSDLDKLEAAAASHDIVLSTADADDLPAVQAMIKGMKARKQKTGHRSLFIHTSGTGVFADNAKGQYPSDTVSCSVSPGDSSSRDRSTPT